MCGQLICGDCNKGGVTGWGCPTCRAPFDVAAEVRVQRLQKMLKARTLTPGRHTPVAQRNLGRMYKDGKGVTRCYEEAVKWFRLAADKGDAGGQFHLGNMYRTGNGVAQNHDEAVKWFRLAAGQGDASAQFNLGIVYKKGHGVNQSFEEAVGWFRLAAEQGHAKALIMCGSQITDVAAARASEWGTDQQPSAIPCLR